MNIVVIARTRNEQRNIYRFCESYQWADSIVVADGGSDDLTVPIASQFSNVHIRRFTERVSKDGGKTWRNPHGKHINFMIAEANKLGADYIIFDDVDCFPTPYMKSNCRRWLENANKDFSFVNRIYAYGNSKYFKQLTLPGGSWEKSTSLYGWKSDLGFMAQESDPFVHDFSFPKNYSKTDFRPPLAIIHDYYPDGDTRMKKVEFYRKSGEQPGCRDPKVYGGNIIEMENWMKYE